MATQDQKRKAAAQTGLYLVVLLAIAIAANVLSVGMNKRWDRTDTKRYTLSEGSGRLVANLNSPIEVEAYVTKGLAQVDAFVRDLTDLLKEYERSSKGKFKFTLVEAKTDEQREAESRTSEPLVAAEQHEQGGERDADGVVRDPSDRVLARHRRCRGDGRVTEGAARHVREPATDAPVVGARQAEERFTQHTPGIHHASGDDADGGGAECEVHGVLR